MCPISVTDTSIHLIRKIRQRRAQGLSAAEDAIGRTFATMWKGHAVHDRARRRLPTSARSKPPRRCEDGVWRLYGDKMVLPRTPTPMSRCCWRARKARPGGTKGLALFALPRPAEGRPPQRPTASSASRTNWGRDRWRAARLCWRAAVAYLVGDADRGPQADDGAGQPVRGFPTAFRARRDDAALRQRGFLSAPRTRVAFGKTHYRIFPCSAASFSRSRLPTEQSLSMFLFTAKRDGPRQCRLRGSRKPAAHSHAAAKIPRLCPRQHSGGDPAPWRSAAATAISRNG